jgi:hypothetical protein
LVARQGISDVRGPASRLIAELFSLGVCCARKGRRRSTRSRESVGLVGEVACQ